MTRAPRRGAPARRHRPAASPPALPALGVQRLTDGVYRMLREGILARTFPPGQRLWVDEFAGQPGVSRTPLKDALNLLASEGLVEIQPRRGRSCPTSRRTTSRRCSRSAARSSSWPPDTLVARVTPAEADELRAQMDALREAVERSDAAEHMRRNLAFPQRFVELAGNRRLAEMYEGLRAHIQIGRVHARRVDWLGRLRQEPREHAEILAALDARDTARLAAVDAHIRRAKASLIQDLAAGGAGPRHQEEPAARR